MIKKDHIYEKWKAFFVSYDNEKIIDVPGRSMSTADADWFRCLIRIVYYTLDDYSMLLI